MGVLAHDEPIQAARLLDEHLEPADGGSLGAHRAVVEECPYGGRSALETDLDGPVGKVLGPAGDAVGPSTLTNRGPVEDTLHAAVGNRPTTLKGRSGALRLRGDG